MATEPKVLTLESYPQKLNIEPMKVATLPEKFDIESIKEEARKVVSLRKSHADDVKSYAQTFNGYGVNLPEWLLYIEKNIATDHVGATEQNIVIKDIGTFSLVELCREVREMFAKVSKDLNTLESRFRNKRILVTSIGKARQGKSLLTQLYTGREDIIKVEGSAQDCTGSVCVLHHDGSMNPKDFQADVLFYTKEEALEALKDLLDSIRKQDKNFATDIIPKEINSFDDVSRVINDKEKQKKIEKLTTPTGVTLGQLNTLINYFSNDEYISCLSDDKDVHDVFSNDVTKLEEYNYIPSPHPKYLAVKRIDLTTNLGHDGLFEYFDIADTRGASDTSGCANDDIYEAIQDSDAVFSIHRQDKGKLELGFYDTALNRYKNKESFIRKHFIIINEQFYPSTTTKSSNKDEVSISMCLKQIRKYALTDVFYVGQLLNDENPNLPKEFANRLMVDMLAKIAKEVRSLDQDRMDECNENIGKLQTLLTVLQVELNKIELFTQFDKKFFINRFIDSIRGSIGKELNSKRTALGYNSGMQPDYLKLKESNDSSIITLGDILIGRRVEHSKDNTNEIVPILLKEIMEKIEKSYSHKPDAIFIGTYLTKIAREILFQIQKNLRESTNEKIVDISPEKDEIFRLIWDISKIGIVYEEDLPSERSLQSSNQYVASLANMYFEKKHDLKIDQPRIFSPYRLLALYFKNVSDKLEEKKEESGELILEDDKLRTIMIQIINELGLEEYVRKGLVKRKGVIQSLYDNLTNFFKTINSSDCVEFYLEHSNLVTSENPDYEKKNKLYERDKVILEKKDGIFGAIPDIMSVKKLILPKAVDELEEEISEK